MRCRCKGFPVRVLEQAAEFREIGAGIQLAPNIFAAADRIGLKDALLADAWQPPAMEMRCALSGELVTRMPLGAGIHRALRAALCGDPPRRHPCASS